MFPGYEVEPTPGGPEDREVEVTVLACADPARIGAVFPLLGQLVVGRVGGEGLDLALADRGLSRRQLRIVAQGLGRYAMEDLGSKNGTRVDGEEVRRAPLRPGSVLRAGGTLLHLGRASHPLDGELCTSWAWTETCRAVDRVAPTPVPVWFSGEVGSGRHTAARRLHARSARPGPFVIVDCATDSPRPDRWASARGGTLLLDHVDALGPSDQAEVITHLEDGATDARVVAAATAVRASPGGVWAEIPLAPLRERRRDILALARHFLSRRASPPELTWSIAFAEALVLRAWPANVRQLRDELARLASLAAPGDVLQPGMLSPEPPSPGLDRVHPKP